jgi:hypothetical protein
MAARQQATLETAVTAAKRFGAALDVLHVMADVNSVVPVIGEGMSGAMVEQLMAAMAQTIASRAARAREAYQKISAAGGAKLSWREITGREADVVAAAGRLTDLIVIGRPSGEAEAPLAATLDAALFDTGRPVLVASPTAAVMAAAWRWPERQRQAARVAAACRSGRWPTHPPAHCRHDRQRRDGQSDRLSRPPRRHASYDSSHPAALHRRHAAGPCE